MDSGGPALVRPAPESHTRTRTEAQGTPHSRHRGPHSPGVPQEQLCRQRWPGPGQCQFTGRNRGVGSILRADDGDTQKVCGAWVGGKAARRKVAVGTSRWLLHGGIFGKYLPLSSPHSLANLQGNRHGGYRLLFVESQLSGKIQHQFLGTIVHVIRMCHLNLPSCFQIN